MKDTQPHLIAIQELIEGVAKAETVFARIGADWAFLFHHDLQTEVRSALGRTGPLSLVRRWRLRRLYRLSQRRLVLLLQTAGAPIP